MDVDVSSLVSSAAPVPDFCWPATSPPSSYPPPILTPASLCHSVTSRRVTSIPAVDEPPAVIQKDTFLFLLSSFMPLLPSVHFSSPPSLSTHPYWPISSAHHPQAQLSPSSHILYSSSPHTCPPDTLVRVGGCVSGGLCVWRMICGDLTRSRRRLLSVPSQTAHKHTHLVLSQVYFPLSCVKVVHCDVSIPYSIFHWLILLRLSLKTNHLHLPRTIAARRHAGISIILKTSLMSRNTTFSCVNWNYTPSNSQVFE